MHVVDAAKPKVGLLELYNKLKPGMTREQVEAVVGKPVLPPLVQPDGEVQVNYLGPEYRERDLAPQESPFLPAGIYVTYVGGVLTKKSYNPQWLKR
jgi:hypothetical protein